MSRFMNFAAHRRWEDWSFVVLGFVVAVSPVAAFSELPGRMVVNIVACGMLVLGVSLFEFVRRIPFHEFLHVTAGMWLAISAIALDYGTATHLRSGEIVLGLLIAMLALFEAWQDRSQRR